MDPERQGHDPRGLHEVAGRSTRASPSATERGLCAPVEDHPALAHHHLRVVDAPVPREVLGALRRKQHEVGAQARLEPATVEEPEETYSPVVIRRKVFSAAPMTVDDALYFMELVGHDFYLFQDAETKRPSVVYRRKGWDYGVIELDENSDELREAVPSAMKRSN